MEARASAILERLAVASLEKCLARISRVSAGAWEITGSRVSLGTLEDALGQHDFTHPAAAVYFHVKGEFPFTALLLVDLNDMEHILQAYLGCTFPHTKEFTFPEEVMLTEIGNIILNSLINAVLNALKRSSMPPVPGCVHGPFSQLAAALGTRAGQNCRTVTVSLSISYAGRVSKSEVIGLIPEELENELERKCKDL